MYGFNYATILALAAGTAATSVSTTPHDSYSSSVGVLGCKIDTNRVAYWPGSVDCNNICVKLTYGDRSVNLLRIDQSGGAYDISYDAWAYLQTGKSASVDAITGGGVDMEYEEVDASECADLIKTDGSKLPLSASNSMNFLASCLAEPDSWVAQNHVLYNICDSVCTLGYDETCTLDLAVSNQPSCSHTLGLTTSLTSTPVYNIEYQSGKVVTAGSGVVASGYTYAEASADSSSDSSSESDAEVETVATTSVAPAVSTATTSTVDAVFLEVTSSSSSVQEYKTAPATTTAAATTSSFAPAYSTQSTTAAQTTESASSSATTLVSSVQSSTTAGSSSIASTAAGTSSIASSAVPTSANASSTLVVATKSSSQSSATSSGSAATGTAQPITSGANSKVGASVSALISSIAIYLLVSAL